MTLYKERDKMKRDRKQSDPYLGWWNPEMSGDSGWTMSVKVLYMLSSHSGCLPEATRANIPESPGRQDILKSNLSPEYSGLASGAS